MQEYQSTQSLEALNKLAPPHCHVVREGQIFEMLASNLVPGDVIKFTRGDRIPADARIITSISLDIDESSLTYRVHLFNNLVERTNQFEKMKW